MVLCIVGINQEGKPVYLWDIWPSREELQEIERKHVLPAMFQEVYSKITEGNERWNGLDAPDTMLYPWDEKSTYIQKPPFFVGMVCVLWVYSMYVCTHVCACFVYVCVYTHSHTCIYACVCMCAYSCVYCDRCIL